MDGDRETFTEFEPISPKTERSNVVSEFFNKLFTKAQGAEPILSSREGDQPSTSGTIQSENLSNVVSVPILRKLSPAIMTTPATPPTRIQDPSISPSPSSAYARSLSTVTHRISTLLLRSTNSPMTTLTINEAPLIDYKQSDFRQYWMPDSRGKECYECQEKFTTFRRRHHCRICGQIFCSKCCKQEIPGRLLGYMGNLRLCNYCCRAVAQYLKTPAGEQTLKRKGSLEVTGTDLRSLRENLSRSFNDSGLSLRKTSVAVGSVTDDCEQQFRNLHHIEAVDPWIGETSSITTNSVTSRDGFGAVSRQRQSSVCSNGALSAELNGDLNVSGFAAGHADLPSPIPTHGDDLCDKILDFETSSAFLDEWEPDWVKSIQSKDDDQVDNGLFLVSSSASPNSLHTVNNDKQPAKVIATVHPLQQLDTVVDHFEENVLSKSLPLSPNNASETCNQSKKSITTSVEYNLMSKSFEIQAQKLLDYLIRRENVSVEKWRHVLWPLVQEIAFTVQPNVKIRKDDVDILRYVHIKTIRCNVDQPNARITFGTVCTKTVTDNRMKQTFLNPHILIIGGSIEYERVEGKFCSIDPIIMQETEYLRNVVHKILTRKPDIVLVEKTVARIAQHFFRTAGITLVCNLKQVVLRRIARCTQADIVQSIEGQIAKPKLGSCGAVRFELLPISSSSSNGSGIGYKTLLCFEDCPPDLSCAIVVTGSQSIELKRIKKLMKFMIASLYSAKLEMDMLQTFRVCLSATDGALIDKNEVPCDICELNFKLLPAKNIPSELSTYDLANGEGNIFQRRKFVNGVKDAVFYSSPFVQVTLPYLESAEGANCKLRSRFNLDQMYRCGSSAKLSTDDSLSVDDARRSSLKLYLVKESLFQQNNVDLVHPFVSEMITKSASTYTMKRNLAKFRAESAKCFRRKRDVEELRPISSRSPSTDKCFTPELSVDEEGTDPVLDVLDPFAHQRIAVLYCSYSPASENAPGFCLKPKVFVMHYYGRFDVTLGDYLERYCFNPMYKCSNELCDGYMVGHIRKLVHGNSCVEISIQNIDVPNSTPRGAGNFDGIENPADVILGWDWCSRCKATTAANVLSKETWHLSFSKYLDYLFNCRYLTSHLVNDTICNCCFLHQHVHYFAYKNSVVCFKTSKITLHDVCFPEPICFVVPKNVPISSFMQEIKATSDKSMETFSVASEVIATLKSVLSDQNNKSFLSWTTNFQELQTILEENQNNFRDMMNSAHTIMAEFTDENIKEAMSNDERFDTCMDRVIRSKYCVASMVQKWNALINDLIIASKKKVDDRPATVLKTGSGIEESGTIDSPIGGPPMNTSGSSSTNLSADEASPIKRTSASDVNTLLGDRKSLTKVLMSSSLVVPFDSTEHYTLPVGSTTAVVARDTELGSIVAYALSTDDYERTRKSMLDSWSQNGIPLTLKLSGLMPQTSASNVFSQSGDGSNSTNVPQHIELQFADTHTKFYCKIYYAEHFRLLRKLLFPDGERAFVRSLSRCEQWIPKGGKSGAIFNRTADKRFVLKQMSRFELQSFIKFAPNYFNYLSTAYSENKLTALAKIFGVFRVGFNNSQTSTAMKMDFIVMEYLFYNRNVSQVYDLKGSLRNRLATTASSIEKHRPADDYVLLDENLLRRICTNSFYCFPHSKAALNVAILNDSNFLASNTVMDYSLLCAVDDEKNELILGIIDYMRTYTWDKRVESLLKSVSVTGQLPTVISPELYRDRFVEIMDTYFPVAPDQWTGLGYDAYGQK